MGCFCAREVERLLAATPFPLPPAAPPPDALPPEALPPEALPPEAIPVDPFPGAPLLAYGLAVDPVFPAIDAWLAVRMLPAPAWAPDPDWLDPHHPTLPEPPMSPQALGIVGALVHAYAAARTQLFLDLATPDAARPFARIVATLNRRLPLLSRLLDDPAPWEQLALLNNQLDAVAAALEAGLLPRDGASASLDLAGPVAPGPATPGAPSPGPVGIDVAAPAPPLDPWLPLIRRLRPLLPLVSIGRQLELDWNTPGAADLLGSLIRRLRSVRLPALADPVLVSRILARLDAQARLRASFGADPRPIPFERVALAVRRKSERLRAILPAGVVVGEGGLAGMPVRPPNPSLLLNADTLAQARAIDTGRLRWDPPPFDRFALLTAGAPVLALDRALRILGPSPLRATPCGARCDAAAAIAATTPPDSGTGAGRAA